MSLAIVPGSFDPMTLGHLELIREARKRYDRVTVAVMINSEKQYLFDLETRLKIAEASVADLDGVTVISDSGLLIDLYDRLGADAVVKSYRNETDLIYERRMADWNRAHNERFVTVLIPAAGEHPTLSSTEVREALRAGKPLDGMVHPAALPLILKGNGGEA